MRIAKLAAGVVLLSVLASAGFDVAGAAEEEDPRYKWVDLNDDCRSSCDPKKFSCPCAAGV